MLEEKIYKDYVVAVKARDSDKSVFLSFVRAELKNFAIAAKKKALDDNEALGVLAKIKKRLEEARDVCSASPNKDFLQKTEKEIAVLNEYLPVALDESELLALIEQVVTEVGASSIKDMGKVMKEVLAKAGARADAKATSLLVKKRLSAA